MDKDSPNRRWRLSSRSTQLIIDAKFRSWFLCLNDINHHESTVNQIPLHNNVCSYEILYKILPSVVSISSSKSFKFEILFK